ncbi:aldehyde-activating protein [Chromatiales bacterium (ex Bugula neritina AB1)]|nr:aldehyde-activating protein [Chromatiales bacterium (ex Bugula neritina AB1)]
MAEQDKPIAGGCACGHVRYRLTSEPMIVHCCHCSWCQRESGAAFAVNALIEADRVELTKGNTVEVPTPSVSGAGQRFSRCPNCQVTLWTNYLGMSGGMGEMIRFVRVGTLDDPAPFPPDVHIYTSTKMPWVALPPDAPAFEEFYATKNVWLPASLERRKVLQAAAGSPVP